MPMRDRTGLDTEALLLLWAARETGVLDALLSSAGTAAEVAAETDVTREAAETAVQALADLGFVERVRDGYEPTNRAIGLLAKRDVRSVGALPHALDELDLLVDLPETMETGVPPEPPDDWSVNRLGAHAATDDAAVRSAVTAAVHAAPEADRVLDVCGGSGVYAAEFADRGYDVTMLDDAETVDRVEPMLRSRGVRLHPGHPADLDGPYGLAFAGGMLSRVDPAEARSVLSGVADALVDDGTVVLVDTVADGSDAAVAASVCGLAAGHGGASDSDEIRSWLRDAGFADVSVDAVPGTERHAAVGHKRTVD
ncbi:methyltransferase domain-containing protein [Halobaculum sp. D14]|uniref:methyltransferase domain-containing protein n=1 Tax=Halobaculum sp. D14 TaxID=3421642 RepID=UPI003EB8E85A